MAVGRFIAAMAIVGALLISPASAGVLDTAGEVTGGTLGADPVADFAFTGEMQMFGPGGVPVLPEPDDTIKGVISLDLVTAGGTADMTSDVGFFGIPWDMHDVTLSACGNDFTVNTALQFDWNGSVGIPVFSKFRLQPVLNPEAVAAGDPAGGMTFAVEVIDTDNDGIPGQAMEAGPFIGFTPTFTGTARMKGMRPGYHKNEHVEVPGSDAGCTPLGDLAGGFF
jgi:hypothetical protein